MIKQGKTKQVQKEMKKHKDIFEKKNMVSEKNINRHDKVKKTQ